MRSILIFHFVLFWMADFLAIFAIISILFSTYASGLLCIPDHEPTLSHSLAGSLFEKPLEIWDG